MKSVLKGLTLAVLTAGFGLAMVPAASACGAALTQPAVIDTGFTTLSQPAVIDSRTTIINQPAVIDSGATILSQPAVLDSCNTCPAVVEPACATAPVYGSAGFWDRPVFLGGTPVNGFIPASEMPRRPFYEGSLFGHGWL